MKIDTSIYRQNHIKKKDIEEKGEDVFKKIFIENMVKEMMKDINLLPSSKQTQKDLFMEQMNQVLTDKIIQSTDMRWKEILKLNE